MVYAYIDEVLYKMPQPAPEDLLEWTELEPVEGQEGPVLIKTMRMEILQGKLRWTISAPNSEVKQEEGLANGQD